MCAGSAAPPVVKAGKRKRSGEELVEVLSSDTESDEGYVRKGQAYKEIGSSVEVVEVLSSDDEGAGAKASAGAGGAPDIEEGEDDDEEDEFDFS
jgi:hypothetical protein